MRGLWGYLLIRLGAGLVGLLPKRAAQGLGALAGRVWHRFDRRRREMTESHMRRVLGDPADAVEAARQVMASYGRYWGETLWIRARRVPAILEGTTAEGLEHISSACEAGKGVIYGLPHMGNWEAAAPVSAALGMPVVAVAERLPNPRITRWFLGMRAEFGIEIVLATGGAEVMRRLEAALQENKAVALLSDRDLRGRGVPVELFGETTTLPPGPATLALRTGAPLLPVAPYFEGSGHRVVIRPPLPIPEQGSRTEKVRQLTQGLGREMEEMIRARPRQWHLVVPNWPSDKA
ncbi:MAG: phosphatidylinositol mannoside acyltransferase [Actinobacteria bacterium]|nr:phosphatidylinositol mannoside acyltransferase [Actinomycetota bacterium]